MQNGKYWLVLSFTVSVFVVSPVALIMDIVALVFLLERLSYVLTRLYVHEGRKGGFP